MSEWIRVKSCEEEKKSEETLDNILFILVYFKNKNLLKVFLSQKVLKELMFKWNFFI